VVCACVDECLLQPVAVDGDGGVVGMLLDDREQVTEQALLGGRQLRMGRCDLRGWVVELVDRRP
jgi:hypothetical protein